MTTKDFFILVIKLFGLYSVITSLFVTIPQSSVYINSDFGLLGTIYFICSILGVLGLFVLLIFKTPHVVRILKLEKGFDNENLQLGNLTTSEIIKIATIIIGGFLIIDNLPTFINQTFNAFYAELNSELIQSRVKWNWAITGVNLVLGYLLLKNHKWVTRILQIEAKN